MVSSRKIISIFLLILISFFIALNLILKNNFLIFEKKTLYFYTSLPLNVAKEICKEFEKENPDLEVVIKRSSSSYLRKQIVKNILNGNIKLDVGLLADPINVISLKKLNLLLRFKVDDPKKYYYVDKDNYFVSARILIPVIAYSKNFKKAKISSYSEFLKYKNLKMGIVDPHYSGFALGLFYYALNFIGESSLRKMLKNNHVYIFKNNLELAKALKKNKVDIGILIDYFAKNYNISFIYPKENIYIPSPIFIFKSTNDPKLSLKFLKFILSEKVQKIFLKYNMTPGEKKYPLPPSKYYQVNWENIFSQKNFTLHKFEEMIKKLF